MPVYLICGMVIVAVLLGNFAGDHPNRATDFVGTLIAAGLVLLGLRGGQ